MASPDRYYDGFVDFPKGINSGVAPISLPPDQLSYIENGTVRGSFISPRPPILNRTLEFDTPQNQALFENGLWQGAGYFKPSSGSEGYVVQIGGILFFVQIVGDIGVVKNITIPGDQNDPNQPFAWIWQSELWALINNGVNQTIIFDGNSSRRLDPDQEALGTTSADFTVPALGATVSVSLTANFLGQVNQHVIASSNGASYIVTDVGAGSVNNAQLTPVYSDGTASYPVGTPVVTNPGFVARLAVGFSIVAGTYPPPGDINFFVIVNVDRSLGPSWAYPNTHSVVLSDQNGIKHTFTFVGRRDGDSVFSVPLVGSYPNTLTFEAGSIVSATGSPPITIGTLGAVYTVPDVGIPIPTIITPQYNGADIDVFMGNSEFTLHAIPVTPTNTVTLRNVNDVEGSVQPVGTVLYSVPELPPGRMGAYGQGRNWVALPDGRSFIASDLVGSASGTAQYNFTDAVFHTTENMLLAGGGSFFVPGNLGGITAMSFSAILDASLGQGALNVFCPIGVFSCNAPVDRSLWQSLSTPILPEVLIGSGAASQWSVVQTNADIIFRAPDGTVRSLLLARLDYRQWGNTPISYEMLRVILNENLTLMPYCSAIQFDNRMLMTAQPRVVTNGTTFDGLMALNFDTISSIAGKSPSVWEGLWTGINAFWIGSGRFNGIDRAFLFYNNSGKIALKEILPYASTVLEDSKGAIPLVFETPVLFKNAKGKGYFDYAQLVDGELYFSDLKETVQVTVEYRPDFYQNWTTWRNFTITVDPTQGENQFRSRIGLGTPNADTFVPFTKTPTRLGRWFQLRISVTGGRPQCVGGKFSAIAAPQPDFAPVQPCS